MWKKSLQSVFFRERWSGYSKHNFFFFHRSKPCRPWSDAPKCLGLHWLSRSQKRDARLIWVKVTGHPWDILLIWAVGGQCLLCLQQVWDGWAVTVCFCFLFSFSLSFPLFQLALFGETAQHYNNIVDWVVKPQINQSNNLEVYTGWPLTRQTFGNVSF